MGSGGDSEYRKLTASVIRRRAQVAVQAHSEEAAPQAERHPVSDADELHFAPTPDGWRLALHRHRARDRSPALPVLLCGGFSCNRYFIDYDEHYSLARFLARAGFDAWVLELRGRGLSHPTKACRHPGRWTFDDLATVDVPAAVEHVVRETRQEVAWIGHSMGGMVLYAYLGTRPRAPVRAGVTIASPVRFPGSSGLLHRIGEAMLNIPLGDVVRQRLVLGALWWVLSPTSGIEVGMNAANVDRAEVGRALRLSISNVSRFKLQQLSRWSLEGKFASVDGRVDYLDALAGVATPLLVVAGSGDRLATPAAVRTALDRLPSATYQEFGRAHGHVVDYGHVDLILGRAAPTEVFPVVAEWLTEHASNPPRP
jgi:predicted alpha/beta hydrolase